jgi:ATP-dependent RNA helicase DDX35
LYALGALDYRGNLTTPIGEQMSEFPLPPTFTKMLLTSGEYGCAEEVTTIAALLQVESVFQTPYGQNAMRARMTKRKFEVAEGDLLTLLNVFTAYLENGRTKLFCQQNFLHYKRLRRAEQIKKQMLKMLNRFGIPIESCKGKSLLTT